MMQSDSAPLVSVLMPAYNAAGTIQLAIASLIAQTYHNWECIVVDDGSSDETAVLVEAVDDPRISLVRLGCNYGRGEARRRSLQRAAGKYVTMLDADDWLYPEKIASQVEFLETNPDVTVHSMGMAIVDDSGLVSVRRPMTFIDRRLDSLHRTFIPHAPSMIRRSDIGGATYDRRFKLAQDQDFLRRILIGNRYVVSTDIGYCYTEIQSVSIKKVIRGYFYNSIGYIKLIPHFHLKALFFFIMELAKIPYTALVFIAKGQRYILDSRSTPPSSEDKQDFQNSFKQVVDALKRVSIEGVPQ